MSANAARATQDRVDRPSVGRHGAARAQGPSARAVSGPQLAGARPKLSGVTRTVVVGEPPAPLAAWLRSRRELGQDLFDEVWDGEYHVVPAAHSRHAVVQAQVAVLLHGPARAHGLWPAGPANIGESGNFRVPDHVIFADHPTGVFEPTAAIAVEVVSPGDETYQKFGFYFDRGVRELLIVDPQRRAVEWYTRGPGGFERVDGSALLELTESALTAEIDWPA